MVSTVTNNYTLGRGKVHFARFTSGLTPGPFRYIGNTPELNLTIESEELDHFSSDGGIREKDDSVPLEVNRTGSMITDNIDPENVALFFFGTKSTVTTVAANGETWSITDIELDRSYKIEATTQNPTGVFGISESNLTVAINMGANLVEGTDFEIDYDMGIISFLSGGSLSGGEQIDVTYDLRGSTRDRVISGSAPVEGAMMYQTNNPKGTNSLFYMPYVKVSPNGDYALKGDEWQQIPFSLEILKPSGGDAITRDGVPVYA